MIQFIKKIIFQLLIFSLIKARNEQGYKAMVSKIKSILPSLKDQYTSFVVEGNYLETKVYNLHAFQTQLLLDAINSLTTENKNPVIVDIGDSSGNHILYLKSILKAIVHRLDTVWGKTYMFFPSEIFWTSDRVR